MAEIGYDDEFSYLEDENSDADEESFAPKIKGSGKPSLSPEDNLNEESEKTKDDETKEQKKEEIGGVLFL